MTVTRDRFHVSYKLRMLKKFRIVQAKWIVTVPALSALAILIGCGTASSHLGFITLRGSNAVAAYRINDHSAAFTSIIGSPFAAGVSPSFVLAHPSKKFIYVANQTENDISLFNINSESGVLTEVTPRTPTGFFPSSLAMDTGGTSLYVANEASNSISVFTINSGTGALTITGSPFATGPGPTRLRVSPSGKFLYVLCSNLTSIYAYAIASGALQPVAGSPFQVGPSPSSFVIDPAEHFVYVTNASTSTVSVFAINSGSGALAVIPQSPFSTMTTPTSTLPTDVATSPSGQFLYVLNSSTDNISEYSIGSGGVLTLLTNSPVATSGTGPIFLTFDSTGTFLFVGNQGSNTINGFSVGSDGTLASTSSSQSVGASPSSMAVLP